jgi:hypothetical protein
MPSQCSKACPLCLLAAFVLLATCLLDGLLNYSSTLKMEAIRSSETSGATQRTTRRHIPEDDTLQRELSVYCVFYGETVTT